MGANFYVGQAANLADCHSNTVRRYDAKGLIRSFRDANGYRRYTLEEVLKLKAILAVRS